MCFQQKALISILTRTLTKTSDFQTKTNEDQDMLYFFTSVPISTLNLLTGLLLVWPDTIWSTDVRDNACIHSFVSHFCEHNKT